MSEFEVMLQTLLIEQFKIKLHHESKLFPAYQLKIASGGARLKVSDDQNAPDAPLSPPKIGADGFPVLPPGHGARAAFIRGGHYARFQNCSMADLAERLANWMTPQGDSASYIIDETGLAGLYDFTLKFNNMGARIAVGPAAQVASAAGEGIEPGSGLPNIFRALEQQLGLKLVKTKNVPRDTIVVDHAERIPSGN
jgi:uncharacterized protein (TIGR03435 family)